MCCCERTQKSGGHHEKCDQTQKNEKTVEQKGCHPNENIAICKKERNDLIDILGPAIAREFGEHFPGCVDSFMELHKDSAPDIACLTCGSQCLPWNGIQINVDHLLCLHSDYSDTENVPSANFFWE